jgi:hypothetical protein
MPPQAKNAMVDLHKYTMDALKKYNSVGFSMMMNVLLR